MQQNGTTAESLQVLNAANSMAHRDAAKHYLDIGQLWYSADLKQQMRAFKDHIPQILKLVHNEDEHTRLPSLRTLAFISSNNYLHEKLFENGILPLAINILCSSQESAEWEAALVVLNQVCWETKQDFKQKHKTITDFFQSKEHLGPIFHCGNVEDVAISIIANTFSLLSKIVNSRFVIQEHCARAGLVERAYNLQSTHHDEAVRSNAKLFLKAMGLQNYGAETYNEMYAQLCMGMGLSSRAMSLSIWKLCHSGRKQHAKQANKLVEVILAAQSEDELLTDPDAYTSYPKPKPDKPKQNKHRPEREIDVFSDSIPDIEYQKAPAAQSQPPPNDNHQYSNQNNYQRPASQSVEYQPNRQGSVAYPDLPDERPLQSAAIKRDVHYVPPKLGTPTASDEIVIPSSAYQNQNKPVDRGLDYEREYPRNQNICSNDGLRGRRSSSHPTLPKDIPEDYTHSRSVDVPKRKTDSNPGSPPKGPDRYPSHAEFDIPGEDNSSGDEVNFSSQRSLRMLSRDVDMDNEYPLRADEEKTDNYIASYGNRNMSHSFTGPNRSNSNVHQPQPLKQPMSAPLKPHNPIIVQQKSEGAYDHRKPKPSMHPLSKSVSYTSESVAIDLRSPQIMAPQQSKFLEEDIDIAVLHTSPIFDSSSESETTLALEQERAHLRTLFQNTPRQLNVFFGVLTRTSLINCIHRGAQIIHISGHGPPAKKLRVEDTKGGLEDIQDDLIREAINQSKSKTKLKLVFVSMCYSGQVAHAFTEVGVQHVVAVHSMVQILDTVATRFAQAFYENLIARKETVQTAFQNSVSVITMDGGPPDCCCRHDGHKKDCLCPLCKKNRCCKSCHTEACPSHTDLKCCHPDAPHQHKDKFLMLPVNDKHEEKILHEKEAGVCDMLRNDVPTNISRQDQKLVNRREMLYNLVTLLHPAVVGHSSSIMLYGKHYVGCTSVAEAVSGFFTREWYTPLFSGGVWSISLRALDNPKTLFMFIAHQMKCNVDPGSYSYLAEDRQFKPYKPNVQKQIHEAVNSQDPPIVRFYDPDSDSERFILLRRHASQLEKLESEFGDALFQTLKKEVLPKTKHLSLFEVNCNMNDEKVQMRRIQFASPDESQILTRITADTRMSDTLFIFDDIEFKGHPLKTLLTKIQTLIKKIPRARLLLVCHEKQQQLILRQQEQNVKDCGFQCREIRLPPVSRSAACSLLRLKTRELYLVYDFDGLEQPQSEEDIAKYPLFQWLSRAPGLIASCGKALDQLVPLCVIFNCIDSPPDKWEKALNIFRSRIEQFGGNFDDACEQLRFFLNQLTTIRAMWDPKPKQNSNKQDSSSKKNTS